MTQGTYQTPWQPEPEPCRKCGATGQLSSREWESSCGGYTDYYFRCAACNSSWWVEGPDA